MAEDDAVVIPTKQQQRDLGEIRAGLEAWLRARLPDSRDLSIASIDLPKGAGVANETLLVTATLAENGRRRERGFVVRVGATEHLYLNMDVRTHFQMYEALAREPHIPSPGLIGYEADRSLFGEPFFVMDRVAGLVPADNPNFYETGWVAELSTEDRRALWRNTIAVMAKLHALEPSKFAFLERPHLGRTGLEQELRHWLDYAQWCGGARYPIVRKASDWLVRNLPLDAPPGLSWGDSRPPNIIYQGVDVAAVLDWDTVSLAGAECDLAWWTYMDQSYTIGRGLARPSGFGTPREAIALWQELTGRRPEYLDWHLVFAAFRMRLIMTRLPAMLCAAGQITEAQRAAMADRGEMEWCADLLERPLAGRFDSRWPDWDK